MMIQIFYDLYFRGLSGVYYENAAYDLSDLIFLGMPAGLAGMGFLLDAGWNSIPDVLPEMVPGTTLLNRHNSTQGISSEAQKLTARASISTQYPVHLAPWAAILNDYGVMQAEIIRQRLMMFAHAAFYYFQFHPDWDLRENAWLWDEMFLALAWIPADWQYMTGATTTPSDGIVAEETSNYPGSNHNYHVPVTELAIHHKAQLKAVPNHDADFYRSLISTVLTDLFLDEPPPPPPPTLEVTMEGETEVQPTSICTWWSNVTGGTPPYTYSWSGALSGSQEWIDGVVSQSSWLYLTVTSSDQQQASDQIFVEVSQQAMECSAQRPG